MYPPFEKSLVYKGNETLMGKFMTFFTAVWSSFGNILTFGEISAAVLAYGKKSNFMIPLGRVKIL